MVNVNHIKGYHHFDSDHPQYIYFQEHPPVARAGYSMYIDHLTFDQAAKVRTELRLALVALPSI